MLTTVYLWALIKKIKVRAAAPTGIAAANIEIENTDIASSTIHALFEFDGDYISKLDFTKIDNKKVVELLELNLLLLDEVSMMTYLLSRGCFVHVSTYAGARLS